MFFVFPYGVITDMDKPPFMNHFLGMVSIESCCCMIYRGVCLQDVHIHIYIYLVIDLKVLVRSFNCESRACYVGNPRECFFFHFVSRKLDTSSTAQAEVSNIGNI